MILASLARYYRRLAAETDEMGNPKVPPYGFSEEKIGWILVLDKEGRLKTQNCIFRRPFAFLPTGFPPTSAPRRTAPAYNCFLPPATPVCR